MELPELRTAFSLTPTITAQKKKKIPACHCATSGLTRLKKLSFKAVSHFKEVLIAYRGSQLLQEMFEVIAVVGEKRTIVIIVII